MQPEVKARLLLYKPPYAWWWPVAAGVLAGIALRVLYSGRPGGPYATMMAGFIYFSPAVVGAVTVFVAETQKRRTWAYYFLAAFAASCFYVLGTLLILIEGLICAIVILPLFGLLAGLGGLLMGAICRWTNWPKPTLYCLGVLPLIFGSLESNLTLPERRGSVEQSIVIDASPEEIWQQILHVESIEPKEIDQAWLFRIGAPVTKSGMLGESDGQRVRRVTMGKGIHFDEVITHYEEARKLRWTYRYYDDSFPAYALDEHVVLGGHYLDIEDTTYVLTPKGSGTELSVIMNYRISTQFNWYADPVARLLFGNLAKVNLEFYRRKSEAGT